MDWDNNSLNCILEELSKSLGIAEDDRLIAINKVNKHKYKYTSPINYCDDLYIAHNREELFVPIVANIINNYIKNEENSKSSNLDGTKLNHAPIIYKDICRSLEAHYGGCSYLDFLTINKLSAMSYEKDRLKAELAFIPVAFSPVFNIDFLIEFKEPEKFPLSISQLKRISKLCAGVKNKKKLLFCHKNEHYYCYGYVNDRFIAPYSVKINGIYNWEFCVEDDPIFRVEHGEIKVLQNVKIDLKVALKSEFAGIHIPQKIGSKVLAISKQKHGASIIFLDLCDPSSKEAVERLAKFERSVQLPEKKFFINEIDEDMLEGIARIDGTIIVNINDWEITLIAAIVDGIACNKGLLDRGARHNSIHTFLSSLKRENSDVKGVAMIFSEDGDVTPIRASKL